MITQNTVDYNLGKINGFEQVNITMKNNKYLIAYFISSSPNIGETFCEIKDAIIGGFGFLANEDFINKHFNFYDNYEECLKIVSNRTLENLMSDFEKYEMENNNFILAIKTN